MIVFNSNEKYTSRKMENISNFFEKSALKIALKIRPTISYGASRLSENLSGDLHDLVKIASQRMKRVKISKKIGRI